MGLAFNLLAQQLSNHGYSIHQIDAEHYQLVQLDSIHCDSGELLSKEQVLQRLEGLQKREQKDLE